MRIAIIQDDDSSYRAEAILLREGLQRLGFAVRSASHAKLAAHTFDLPGEALVAGDAAFVRVAMQRLGIRVPPPRDYPDRLRPWLLRSIERSTLGELRTAVTDDGWEPHFVKPADSLKLFQGRRIRLPEDVDRLHEFADETSIWISELVRIVSEFRFYVIRDEIVAIENYDGDPRDEVDRTVVQAAIDAYSEEGSAPAAYAIDFALLRDGRTALVEVNDGYSVGTYCEIDAESYARFIAARWDELLDSR